MKLKIDLEKMYIELTVLIESTKNFPVCVNCGHFKSEHKEISTDTAGDNSKPLTVCNGTGDCFCGKFATNELALHDLELRVSVLKWVLDQEETVLEIDDCIMPETVISRSRLVHPKGFKPVTVGALDEPYRTILLESTNKLPVILPEPTNDFVSVASYAVMPNGSVHRTVKTLPEKEYKP